MYESSAKSLILHLRLLVPLHKLLPPNPARSSNQGYLASSPGTTNASPESPSDDVFAGPCYAINTTEQKPPAAAEDGPRWEKIVEAEKRKKVKSEWGIGVASVRVKRPLGLQPGC
uniref:Uncharacterized protein n=1 Tax=Pyricularia oryzae (strain 70-15 / ATCC MYA-4617 / FGSC 8958) TaxID=242507 RepID=Q2KEJ9_PYRO7|nr:hypothetical protein MGCH7_ch7g1037 [Pyricularia oryzae 70-15]